MSNKKEEVHKILEWLEAIIFNGIDMGYGKNQSAETIVKMTVKEVMINLDSEPDNVYFMNRYRK